MKKNPFHFLSLTLRTERGDALVIAMIMAAVCTMTGLAILQYTAQLEENSRRPRVKSLMAATEAKVRELLMAPTSYSGCNTASGRTSCTLDPALVRSIGKPVPGAKCATPNCGILVTLNSFRHDSSGATGSTKADITIHYSGSEMALKDISVKMDIPIDLLQKSGIYKCPPGAAKFMGFNADGTMNCASLPGVVGPGSFVKQIDLGNLTMTTQTLYQAAGCSDATCVAGCGANQLIGNIQWTNGGTTLSYTCMNRPDPFGEFGFVPGSRSGDPAYVPY